MLVIRKKDSLCGAVVAVLLLILSALSLAEPVSKDPCDPALFPEPVREVLKHKFPASRVLTLSDLTDEEQKHWLKSRGNGKCPGIAVGHIEARTYLSYPIVLISREPTKSDSKFLVVSERKKGRFEVTVLSTSFGFVSTVPPGKYTDSQQTEKVQLNLDGILFEVFQKGSGLYYWRNGRYRQLVMSE